MGTRKKPVQREVTEILGSESGIWLDIGCGGNKQRGFVGLDMRPLPGVDIVCDINFHPWPLPDNSVKLAMASHVLEHIPGIAIDYAGKQTHFPFIEFMNEVWRIMLPGGQFAIAVPHGSSPGFQQDPTHINAMNEARWAYFDPLEDTTKGMLYRIYRPKPWKILSLSWDPAFNMEVVLEKRLEDRSYYE